MQPATKDFVLITETYRDRHGNNGYGKWIARARKQKNGAVSEGWEEYIILAPQSLVRRWSSINATNAIVEIPSLDEEKYKVGYYTTASHYRLLKSIGAVPDFLDRDAVECFEKLTDAYDERCFTGVSSGLNVKKSEGDSQKTLYTFSP